MRLSETSVQAQQPPHSVARNATAHRESRQRNHDHQPPNRESQTRQSRRRALRLVIVAPVWRDFKPRHRPSARASSLPPASVSLHVAAVPDRRPLLSSPASVAVTVASVKPFLACTRMRLGFEIGRPDAWRCDGGDWRPAGRVLRQRSIVRLGIACFSSTSPARDLRTAQRDVGEFSQSLQIQQSGIGDRSAVKYEPFELGKLL